MKFTKKYKIKVFLVLITIFFSFLLLPNLVKAAGTLNLSVSTQDSTPQIGESVTIRWTAISKSAPGALSYTEYTSRVYFKRSINNIWTEWEHIGSKKDTGSKSLVYSPNKGGITRYKVEEYVTKCTWNGYPSSCNTFVTSQEWGNIDIYVPPIINPITLSVQASSNLPVPYGDIIISWNAVTGSSSGCTYYGQYSITEYSINNGASWRSFGGNVIYGTGSKSCHFTPTDDNINYKFRILEYATSYSAGGHYESGGYGIGIGISNSVHIESIPLISSNQLYFDCTDRTNPIEVTLTWNQLYNQGSNIQSKVYMRYGYNNWGDPIDTIYGFGAKSLTKEIPGPGTDTFSTQFRFIQYYYSNSQWYFLSENTITSERIQVNHYFDSLIDLDEDSLTDYEELEIYNTNRSNSNTDGDDFDDYYEIREAHPFEYADPNDPCYPVAGHFENVVLEEDYGESSMESEELGWNVVNHKTDNCYIKVESHPSPDTSRNQVVHLFDNSATQQSVLERDIDEIAELDPEYLLCTFDIATDFGSSGSQEDIWIQFKDGTNELFEICIKADLSIRYHGFYSYYFSDLIDFVDRYEIIDNNWINNEFVKFDIVFSETIDGENLIQVYINDMLHKEMINYYSKSKIDCIEFRTSGNDDVEMWIDNFDFVPASSPGMQTVQHMEERPIVLAYFQAPPESYMIDLHAEFTEEYIEMVTFSYSTTTKLSPEILEGLSLNLEFTGQYKEEGEKTMGKVEPADLGHGNPDYNGEDSIMYLIKEIAVSRKVLYINGASKQHLTLAGNIVYGQALGLSILPTTQFSEYWGFLPNIPLINEDYWDKIHHKPVQKINSTTEPKPSGPEITFGVSESFTLGWGWGVGFEIGEIFELSINYEYIIETTSEWKLMLELLYYNNRDCKFVDYQVQSTTYLGIDCYRFFLSELD